MKIKTVELTNIKCYANAEFNFENGINFISGLNGAGKTSIIESIGYALFDYKIGKSGFTTYFIKRGEKKGAVRIIFEDKNRQTYIVERKLSNYSNNSWVIKDTDNEEEIVSGEVDVINWLKDHLGFYREDNMAEIYENIISVPQGMFTSAFLDTAQNRKNKFDPIFNLEIYRTVFKNTAGLESGLKNKKLQTEGELGKLNVKIDMLTENRKEYLELKKQVTDLKEEKKEKEKHYQEIEKEYQEKSQTKAEITKIEESIKIDTIKQESIQNNTESLKKDLEVAKEAKKILEENKQGYENYLQEEKKQKDLKLKQKEYDMLTENKKNLEIHIKDCNTIIQLKNGNKEEIKQRIETLQNEQKAVETQIQEDGKKLDNKLLSLEQERRNIEELKNREVSLEQEKQIIEKNELMLQADKENIARIEKSVTKEKEYIKQKEKLEEYIATKESVEKEKSSIEEKLNKLSARLEQAKESKKIAKDGICPYLKSECINVKGKTQKEYEQEIENIEQKIAEIKKEKTNIEKQEREIIKAEAELKNVNNKMQEVEEQKKELDLLQKEVKEKQQSSKKAEEKIHQILDSSGIEKNLEKIEEFKIVSQAKQKAFNEQDREYNIFKTNLENLKKEQEKTIKEIEKNKQAMNKIESEIQLENEKIVQYNHKTEEIKKELKQYATIEQEIEENEKQLQQNKGAHDIYIQNKQIATKVQEVEKQLDSQLKEIDEIKKKLTQSTNQLESLNKNYNEAEFKKIEENRNELNIILVQLNTKIQTNDTRLKALKEQVDELKLAKEKLKQTQQKIIVYKKAIDYLTKIRQIIKQAPEDISEILIQKVSRKATEMYSKIANDNTRLEWREGYEVVLVDNIDGKVIEKDFRQLSGGEQMSAALAIRISMLEILTSLQIGILDEPTVNMDTGRRQRLAEIIESIGGFFVQLFVVSHDDTFNAITENTIQLS